MTDKPIKITEYMKDDKNNKQSILLFPTKDGTKWQFINLTKGHICPCQFDSRDDALHDFVKYSSKFSRVEFEELDCLPKPQKE